MSRVRVPFPAPMIFDDREPTSEPGSQTTGHFQGKLTAIAAHVAQLVEHFLGKEEVHRFDPGRGLQ